MEMVKVISINFDSLPPKKKFLYLCHNKKITFKKKICKKKVEKTQSKNLIVPPQNALVRMDIVQKKIIKYRTERDIMHFALAELTQKFIKMYYRCPKEFKMNGCWQCPHPNHKGDRSFYKVKKTGLLKKIPHLERSHHGTSRKYIVDTVLDDNPDDKDLFSLLKKVIAYHIDNDINVYFCCTRCNKESE